MCLGLTYPSFFSGGATEKPVLLDCSAQRLDLGTRRWKKKNLGVVPCIGRVFARPRDLLCRLWVPRGIGGVALLVRTNARPTDEGILAG